MKRLIPIIAIIIIIILIRNTAISIIDATKQDGAKEKLEKQIAAEEKRQIFLQERLYYVETDEFVEEEAKEKLGMLAPGEVFVIAPTEAPAQEMIEFDDRPNWRKWLDLFF